MAPSLELFFLLSPITQCLVAFSHCSIVRPPLLSKLSCQNAKHILTFCELQFELRHNLAVLLTIFSYFSTFNPDFLQRLSYKETEELELGTILLYLVSICLLLEPYVLLFKCWFLEISPNHERCKDAIRVTVKSFLVRIFV